MRVVVRPQRDAPRRDPQNAGVVFFRVVNTASPEKSASARSGREVREKAREQIEKVRLRFLDAAYAPQVVRLSLRDDGR